MGRVVEDEALYRAVCQLVVRVPATGVREAYGGGVDGDGPRVGGRVRVLAVGFIQPSVMSSVQGREM